MVQNRIPNKILQFYKKSIKKDVLNKELRQTELLFAEIILIKETQKSHLADEIKALTKNKSISKSSSIYKLSPFLDKNEVVRVNGRIENANVTEEMKTPAILPKKAILQNC